MSLTQLQSEAAELTPAERRRLIAYLVTLENAGEEDRKSRLASKIDSGLEEWVELDQLDKKLGDRSESD